MKQGGFTSIIEVEKQDLSLFLPETEGSKNTIEPVQKKHRLTFRSEIQKIQTNQPRNYDYLIVEEFKIFVIRAFASYLKKGSILIPKSRKREGREYLGVILEKSNFMLSINLGKIKIS